MKNVLIVAVSLMIVSLVGCGGDEKKCPKTDADTTAGLTATNTSGSCVLPGCCENKADMWINVNGMVIDSMLTGATGTPTPPNKPVKVTPVSPGQVLNPTITDLTQITHLMDTDVSLTTGQFATQCFDTTSVALGLVLMVDDAAFDGAAGDYFPSGTGIVGWKTNSEKVCSPLTNGAKAMAISNTLVATMKTASGGAIDAAAKGMAMGVVVDSNQNPVSGAIVKEVVPTGGTPVLTAANPILYPKADFSMGTSTTNGTFIIPGPIGGVVTLTAEKSGMTFQTDHQAATKVGFVYFVYIY